MDCVADFASNPGWLITGSTLDTFRCFDVCPKFGHSGVPEIPVTHAALCVSFSIQGASVETKMRQVCVNQAIHHNPFDSGCQ